jgi:hypothetical protein
LKGHPFVKLRSIILAFALTFASGVAQAWTVEELEAAISDDRARIARGREEVAALKANVASDKGNFHHVGLAQDRNRLDDAQNRLARDKVQLHDHKKALKQLRKSLKTAE